ncbi:MAG: hypothetical protein LC650_02060 [Actinobacteria bacterium]|nr:hypothetical protein [Actinomycetota bacterium]
MAILDCNSKEEQLEQIAEKVINRAENITLAPPIFELYAALLSMSLAMVMFLFPELLELRTSFYAMMTAIMPQGGWAFGFFIGGVASALGMLFDSTWMRVWALLGMAFMYGTLAMIYGFLLPNFGFVFMIWITAFTVASIPLTKYTGIWNRKKEEYKHDAKNDRFS